MSVALREALLRLRARRSRTGLAFAGIFAASLMLGVSIAVAYALGTGFDRAAVRADLPDVIARFHRIPRADVDRRIRALPDLAARSYRVEVQNLSLSSGAHSLTSGVAQVVLGGRRGYAIVAGRDLSGAPGEVVVERGLADSWGLRPGDTLGVDGIGAQRVVGISVSPDNVAYPLASTARVYLPRSALPSRSPRVNLVLLWANNRSQVPAMLVQARALSFGVTDLRFVTRAGVRVLIDQAAGIVIALLVAFSLVAVGAAGIMLAASSHAEVQRRLAAIGVERALGFSRAHLAGRHALEGALVALPAGVLGLFVGALATAVPVGQLLRDLNELGPGWSLAGPLALALAAVVAIVAAASAWPAWRAASRPPAETLRGGDVEPAARGGGRLARGGFGALGARLVAARRARLAATVLVLAASTGVVVLMLALASLLGRLQHDPTLLGTRYELTASEPPSAAPSLRRLPGVTAVAPRYQVDAADSFELGEDLELIAYPGDHTQFEAPPLAAGRRARAADEAEIGQGLADALGVGPGGTLAVQTPAGRELRFRVTGVDRVLERDGRVAYVRSGPLLRAEPDAPSSLAIRLRPGASVAAVSARVARRGTSAARPGAATSSNASFLAVLAGVLRVVAGVDAAICLYALVQALALTARERRSTISLLRATGAGRGVIARVFAGAALVVVVPAAVLGIELERLVLGPVVARLAAGYVSLPIVAGPAAVAGVAVGVVALAGLAALWVGRGVVREPVVAGLREG